jgi:hypothetical protein
MADSTNTLTLFGKKMKNISGDIQSFRATIKGKGWSFLLDIDGPLYPEDKWTIGSSLEVGQSEAEDLIRSDKDFRTKELARDWAEAKIRELIGQAATKAGGVVLWNSRECPNIYTDEIKHYPPEPLNPDFSSREENEDWLEQLKVRNHVD